MTDQNFLETLAGVVAFLQVFVIGQTWRLHVKVGSVQGTLHGYGEEGGIVQDVKDLRTAKHKSNEDLTKIQLNIESVKGQVALVQKDISYIGRVVDRRFPSPLNTDDLSVTG